MGQPVPIFEMEPIKLVTVYVAQTYWQDRAKLAHGRCREFRTERQAVEMGAGMAKRCAGVLVYSVTGNPEADYWQEPRLLAKFGNVPDVAF